MPPPTTLAKMGPLYKHMETAKWFVNGSMCNVLWDTMYRGRIGQVQNVDRHTSHVIFLMQFSHLITKITLHGSRRATQCVCVRASFHLHVIHDVCLSVRWLFLVCLFVFVLLLFLSSLPHSTCTSDTPSSMSTTPRVKSAAPPHNEEHCPMTMYHLLMMEREDCESDFED